MIFKNSVISILGIFISIISTLIAAKIFTKDLYGELVLILTQVGVLTSISMLGVGYLTIREVNKSNNDGLNYAIVYVFILQLTISIIGGLFLYKDNINLLAIILVLIATAMNEFVAQWLRAQDKTFSSLILSKIMLPLSMIIATIAAYFINNSPIISYSIIFSIFGAFIPILLHLKYLKIGGGVIKDIVKFFRESLSIGIISMISTINLVSDIIYLGFNADAEYIANYKMTILISPVILLLHTIYNHTFASELVIFWREKNHDKINDIHKKSTINQFFYTLTIVFFSSLFYQDILDYFYGEKYTVDYNVMTVMFITAIIFALLGCRSPLVMIYAKKNHLFMIFIFGTMVNFLLLCVKRFIFSEIPSNIGIMGYTLFIVFSYIYIHKKQTLSWKIK